MIFKRSVLLPFFVYQVQFLFVLAFIPFAVIGQNINDDIDLDELVSTYDDASYVILDASVEINVLRSKSEGLPTIERREKLIFKSLKDNTKIVKTYYHYNNSSIELVKGKKFVQTSGDVDSKMIFYSDRQFVSFSKYLKDKGDQATLETVERYDDFRFYTQELFIYGVPVIKEKVTFNIDTAIQLNILLFNEEGFNIQHDTSFENNIRTEVFTLNNVLPYKKENNATPLLCNYPHTLTYIQSFVSNSGIKITAFETVDDLYDMYEEFVMQTQNDTVVLRSILNDIVSENTDTLQMVEDILSWVQDKIRYIAFEYEIAGFIPENAQTVVENRYGDCKGISNVLKTFLIMQGLDARLCWLNANPTLYDYSIPSVAVDNHVICAFIYHNEPMFLDATNDYVGIEGISELLQGKQVLIENNGEPWIYHIPVLSVKSNRSEYMFDLETNNNILEGTVNASFVGNKRAQMTAVFKEYKIKTQDFITNVILNSNSNLLWCNEDSALRFIEDSIVTFSSEITIQGSVFSTEDRILVKMCPMQNVEIQKIKKNRVNDFQFSLRDDFVQSVSFAIPDSFSVLDIPNDTIIASPIGEVSYKYLVNDSTIEYCRTYYNDQLILPKEEITHWNEFVKKIIIEDNRRVILQKRANE